MARDWIAGCEIPDEPEPLRTAEDVYEAIRKLSEEARRMADALARIAAPHKVKP